MGIALTGKLNSVDIAVTSFKHIIDVLMFVRVFVVCIKSYILSILSTSFTNLGMFYIFLKAF